MTDLVIVESPAKAKTIQKYLGRGFSVVASMGHVRDLPAARLSVDIEHDFTPKYTVIKGKNDLVKDLKKQVAGSGRVYLATDPDREGEAISWHLAELFRLDLSEKNRVTFNEITKSGIETGMHNPHQIDMQLVSAQQARRILDRLVGYRLSPFVSQKIRRGLSAGRVQSVAVRLIVDREEEIRAFVPEEYWSLDAKFAAPSRKVFAAAFYGDESGKLKLENKDAAQAILDRLENALYTVKSVKKGTRKKNPSPPFITSTLQQEASHKLGFPAARTMKIAQELYEGVDVEGIGTTGLITYMRTDSLRISQEAADAGRAYIEQTFGKAYLPEKPHVYRTRANAQDGHEAIRPSMPELSPEQIKSSLSAEQYKLYTLIWKRFLASQMACCLQNTIKAEIMAARQEDAAQERYCLFTASGYSIRFDGFTKLYESGEEDPEKSGMLPDLTQGDSVKLRELTPNQHFTQPPPRYTEASLIKALEENGIGRPSTYATIMSTILKRDYVTRESKQLKPTELGVATTQLLKDHFPRIVNAKFTAQMEDNLDLIAGGNAQYAGILHQFYDGFVQSLEKAKEALKDVKIQLQEDVTDIPCEKCGKLMVVKSGRFGKFLACPGYPECKNTKPIVDETGALCPLCGKHVVAKKSKRGFPFYGCEGYPECQFVTWGKPIGEDCPTCGKSLFSKKGGLAVCLAEGCGFEKQMPRKKKGADDEQDAAHDE